MVKKATFPSFLAQDGMLKISVKYYSFSPVLQKPVYYDAIID